MKSVGSYTVSWYEEDYFANHYKYRDFPRHDAVFPKLLAIKPKSVLDIGCAYGFIVRRCWDKGIRAVGLDVSNWCGKNFAVPGYYVRAVGWAIPFKDKSFDAIWCEGVLEHIPEDKVEQMFQEFSRVADRGILGVSYSHPETNHHVCNHDFQWWKERIPKNFMLGKSGESLDLEADWYVKP